MMRALEGLVVLDFTRYIAGPYAAYLLGHLGAYVIKVEKAITGDDFRMYPPFYNGESLAFPSYNSNKHSLSMDLRNNRAKEILMELLPHVDIVMQNFRAGTIEKMGLDWETIHKINPRIIMANNSGFGQDGPYSKRVAFDSIIQSESGLINSLLEAGAKRPYYPGGNNSDHIGALCFASAIMAAVNERDRTGAGQYLEVDMMSAVVNMFSAELSLYTAAGRPEKINDLAPCGYYHDRNSRFVHISCPGSLWEAFKDVTQIAGLNEQKFSTVKARSDHANELNTFINNWTSGYDGEDIVQMLENLGIGAAVVKDYKDIVRGEHAKAINSFVELEVPYVGKAPYPTIPFKLSASPIEYGRVPKMGEDNYEVLHRFLNVDRETVDTLTKDGVLYQAEHARWK